MILLPGEDQDVGEDLVKSLQNTKYSIDEKLGKSFIDIFSRKPGISSESQEDMKKEKAPEDHQIDPSKYDTGEESDFDGSESSDKDEAGQKTDLLHGEPGGSDEENSGASSDPANHKDHLKQLVEFSGGRMRRKAIFANEIEDKDLKVTYHC